MDRDEILRLVRRGLDEIDTAPIEVTVERVVRIANLIGEPRIAIRFMLELRPVSGSKEANSSDIKKLMINDGEWGDPYGAHSLAAHEFAEDRTYIDASGKTQVQANSIAEIKSLLELSEKEAFDRNNPNLPLAKMAQAMRGIVERTHSRAFVNLCRWERQLAFGNANEQIFNELRSRTDKLISDVAPDVIVSFNAVYRRLQDAVKYHSDTAARDELAQAVLMCRRILKAVTDKVQPAQDDSSEDGHRLTDEKYRNRLKEFTKKQVASERARITTNTMIDGIHDRFVALDDYASKGVHASIALEEAQLCAINTYILAGEILSLAAMKPEEKAATGMVA